MMGQETTRAGVLGRFRIGTKIMGGFGVVLFLMGVVAAVGVTSLRNVSAQYEDLVGRVEEIRHEAVNLDRAVADGARGIWLPADR